MLEAINSTEKVYNKHELCRLYSLSSVPYLKVGYASGKVLKSFEAAIFSLGCQFDVTSLKYHKEQYYTETEQYNPHFLISYIFFFRQSRIHIIILERIRKSKLVAVFLLTGQNYKVTEQ